MSTILEIISTKRSAHHAFIGWIAQNSSKPWLFFNNIVPSMPPKIREAELLNGDDGSIAERDFTALLLSGEQDAIINFEGKPIASIDHWNRHYLTRNTAKPVRKIVFLRDPLNTLASLSHGVRGRRFRSLFGYFYQVVAFETILSSVEASPRSYDRIVTMEAWQTDKDYRQDLALHLGLETFALPAKVSRYGGGSSFEGASFDPSDVGVLFERWRRVETNALFLAPFADALSRAAIRSYFARFGRDGPIDAGVVDLLVERAVGDPEARHYARSFLAPLRRSLPHLARMERARRSSEREVWKALVRARIFAGL